MDMPSAAVHCGKCICDRCMKWWQHTCPYGDCFDDRRAELMPYDKCHGGAIRKQWSDWSKPGEQAHWCRGGIFYPNHECEHFVEYVRPVVRECLGAVVTCWADGTMQCSLIDSMGCEACYEQWKMKQEANDGGVVRECD